MLFVLFTVALTLGIISVRARLMGANGGVVPAGAPRRIASTLAACLTIALFGWGLLVFAWYWPLAAFLVANLIIIGLVAWGAWPFLCRAMAAIDIAVVILGPALWIAYWLSR